MKHPRDWDSDNFFGMLYWDALGPYRFLSERIAAWTIIFMIVVFLGYTIIRIIDDPIIAIPMALISGIAWAIWSGVRTLLRRQ